MKFLNPFSLLINGTLLTTAFSIKLKGKLVGSDNFGNRYYKKTSKNGIEKRWVWYNGEPEPTKVPPNWHGWLHYTLDEPPNEQNKKPHVWQKSAQPNLSGTKNRYLPSGHLAKSGKHAPTTASYKPWEPN